MKRNKFLLSLLLLLVGVVSANAQGLSGKKISTVGAKLTTLEGLTDGYYLMRNYGRKYYVHESSSNSKLLGNKDFTTANLSGSAKPEDLDYIVKVAATSGNYTFQFESGKYMPKMVKDQTITTEATETPVAFTVRAIADSDGQFQIKNTDEAVFLNGNPSEVVAWQEDGKNSNGAYEFYPVTLAETSSVTFSVTYNMVIDGETRMVETVTGITKYAGEDIAAAENLPDFTRATGTTTLRVEEGTTNYTFIVEQDVPFTVSESFETAVWQKVQMHTNQTSRHWQYDGNGVVTVPEVTDFSDKHLWAFVGNILDGFKIYNRVAGEFYTLHKSANGGVRTNMSTEDTNNQFVLAKSSVGGTPTPVCFKLKGDNTLLNMQGGAIQTYGVNDAGSSCRISKIAKTATLNYEVKQYDRVVGTETVTYESYVGETINAADHLPAFVRTFDHHEFVVGWDDAANTYTFSAEEDLPFAVSANTTEGKLIYQYVTMHQNASHTWQYDGEANAAEGAVSLVAKDMTNDRQLWAFVGNIFDGFKIYNKVAGTNMTLRKSANGNVASNMSSTDDRNVFKVYKNKYNSAEYACFKIDGDTHYLNHQSGELKGWDGVDEGSSCEFDLIDLAATLVYTLDVDGETKEVARESVTLGIGDFITATYGNKLPAFTRPADDTEHFVRSTQSEYVFPVVEDLPFQASEDFANAKWHNVMMHTSYTTYYWQYNADAAEATENVTVPDGKSLDDKHLWAFVGNIVDGFKIYNKAAGANMTLTRPELTINARSYMAEGDANNLFKLYASTATAGAACFKLDGDDNYLNMQSSTILGWTSADEGSSCKFFYTPEVTISYQFDDNGTLKTVYEEKSFKNLGDVVRSSDWTLPAFAHTDDNQAHEVTEDHTVFTFVVEQLDDEIPFKISANMDAPIWQAVRIAGADAHFWQYNGETVVKVAQKGAAEDKQLWAFVGNVFEGFKIYNKAAGTSMTLRKPANGESVVKMSTENTNNLFMIDRNNDNAAGKAAFYLKGDDEERRYLNRRNNGDINAWTNDAGCSCDFFTPASMAVPLAELYNVPEQLYYKVRNLVGYPAEAVVAKKTALDAVYTALEADPYDMVQVQVLKDIVEDLDAAESLAFDPTKHYRLVNRNNPNKMLAVTDAERLVIQDFNNAASTVMSFETAEGGYKLQMQGVYVEPVAYQNQYGTAIPVTEDADAASVYVVENISDVPGFIFVVRDTQAENDKSCFHISGSNLVNWTAPAGTPSSHWYLVEATDVDVTLGAVEDAAYSSACYSFPVTMPEGVTAYIGNGAVANGELSLAAATEVAAGAGFILESETAGIKKLTIGAAGTPATSSISGTFRGKTVASESDCYIFGNGSVGAGFYWLPTGTLAIPANKAYLDRVVGGNAVRLLFPGTTGIGSVETDGDADGSLIYDLSGRAVSAPAKGGIYIKNGKKFIVK